MSEQSALEIVREQKDQFRGQTSAEQFVDYLTALRRLHAAVERESVLVDGDKRSRHTLILDLAETRKRLFDSEARAEREEKELTLWRDEAQFKGEMVHALLPYQERAVAAEARADRLAAALRDLVEMPRVRCAFAPTRDHDKECGCTLCRADAALREEEK